MSTDLPNPAYQRPAWLIIGLAVAPAIGLGIFCFGYALVLPDMRDSHGWPYSTAGFMTIINAAGCLAGALSANIMIRRTGLFNAICISAAACVLSLVMSCLSGHVLIFGIARLISGVAAALAFIAGGDPGRATSTPRLTRADHDVRAITANAATTGFTARSDGKHLAEAHERTVQ